MKFSIALLPSGKRQNELSKTAERMFAQDLAGRILSFDEKAAIAFAMIASKRRRTGSPISPDDAQIASICYTHQATIATGNVSDAVF